MPWKEKKKTKLREEFVKNKEASMAELCREYHISRPTGYKKDDEEQE